MPLRSLLCRGDHGHCSRHRRQPLPDAGARFSGSRAFTGLFSVDLSCSALTAGVFCAQINLSRNQLCGYDVWGAGTYTPEGIKAIADAIGVSGSLTQVLAFLSAVIKLSNNALCGVINATYLGSHKSLTPLGTYNAEGIKVIADAIGISRSLTQVDLSGNHLFYEGGKAIANGIRVSPSLTQVLA
eukprot:7036503-Prymnesium_polylepis.1